MRYTGAVAAEPDKAMPHRIDLPTRSAMLLATAVFSLVAITSWIGRYPRWASSSPTAQLTAPGATGVLFWRHALLLPQKMDVLLEDLSDVRRATCAGCVAASASNVRKGRHPPAFASAPSGAARMSSSIWTCRLQASWLRAGRTEAGAEVEGLDYPTLAEHVKTPQAESLIARVCSAGPR
jgi:hypothetical protein